MNERLKKNDLGGTFRRKPWWLRLGLGFCVWTLLGLSFALSTYLGSRQDNVHISWSRIASGYLADFYLWGMLSPLIFMMARRYELRARLPRNLLFHIGLSIALSIVVLSAASPLVWYFGYVNLDRNPTLTILWRNNAFSIYYFHQGLTIYWTTLVVAHALQYYRGQRESEKRTAQLAAQLAQAQLQALKMQIHPHFLFNTLNSIAALLHQDVEVADRMIARLGDFLRLTLTRSDAQTTDFAQELEFLKCYLDIERTRFADRLVVLTEVEPQTLNLAVPNLILQPIVENAIRHGVARQTTAGKITIRAFQESDRFIVQVEDNGPGLETNPNGTNSGIGLSNTRARLAQHYDEDYRLEIVNSENRGVIVTLEIPAIEAAKSET
ncbi:MAG TPA: histidine kinase [Pyrinomonadaceae bacterium]|nr:histidine kinase [Pyrinomonadaceae bacterium]